MLWISVNRVCCVTVVVLVIFTYCNIVVFEVVYGCVDVSSSASLVPTFLCHVMCVSRWLGQCREAVL